MLLLQNPVFLLFIVIISGELIGYLKIKEFSLGSSAVIFTGLALAISVIPCPKSFRP